MTTFDLAGQTEVIGRGRLVCGGPGAGVMRSANTITEVLALIERDDLDQTVLVTDTPSATGIVPLLGLVSGVVCRSGGLNSHLAVLAREFGISCVVGAELGDRETIDGQPVVIANDGSLTRA